MAELTKRCPYCAEEILLAAIRCKHCQSDLVGQVQSARDLPQERSVLQRPVSPWVLVGIFAILVALFFGNFHIVSGKSGTTVVRRESFGYSEAFINVDAITGMPWLAAKGRYPLGCRVLQREGLIESDEAFRDRIEQESRDWVEKAMREAEEQTRRLFGR